MDAPLEMLLTPHRVARFWSNVARGDERECWPWLRAKNNSGYGVTRCGEDRISYTTMAHRVSWIATHGKPIPAGLVIDHLCGNRACCNPSHLRAVSSSVNVRASSRYKAGEAAIERIGPRTVRLRGSGFMVIWREYLEDGKVRQAGRTFTDRVSAEAFAHEGPAEATSAGCGVDTATNGVISGGLSTP